MNLALCKCGTDMTQHDIEGDENEYPFDHPFDAAGTKYRCEELIHVTPKEQYLCARPAYHKDKGVLCGPINGKKLW